MRPHEGSSSTRRLGITLAIGCAVAIVGIALAGPGAGVIGAGYHFLEFYSGVFSLVALSLTVMGGLAATDRLLLLVPHRVLLQAIHRATALAAVGFLGCHELTKLAEKHAGVIDVAMPFVASRKTVVIGLGTIAGYALVIAAFTGVVRGRFAAVPAAWVWRALHSAAYVAWPAALIHGLAAGRHAATWVIVSYAACVIIVLLALGVRIIATWNRASAGPTVRLNRRPPGAPAVAWQSVRAPHPADAMSEMIVPASPAVAGYGEPFAGGPREAVADSSQEPVAAGHSGSPATASFGGREWEPAPARPVYDAVSHDDLGYGTAFYAVPTPRESGEGAPASGYSVLEAVAHEPDAHGHHDRAGDSAEIPAQRRPFESVSDDEFWAFLRGREQR